MIQLRRTRKTISVIDHITCDSCGEHFTEEQFKDLERIHHIHHLCGYYSEYDGDMIDIDLCDNCLIKLAIKLNIPIKSYL